VAVVGDLAYVAYGAGGLQVCQFYGYGIEEEPRVYAQPTECLPAVVRGVLQVPDPPGRRSEVTSLLDASGRTILDLEPGPNDVSDVAPGVYFVRQASSVTRDAPSVLKVVVCR
jgi:hypothetical protein